MKPKCHLCGEDALYRIRPVSLKAKEVLAPSFVCRSHLSQMVDEHDWTMDVIRIRRS